MAANSETGGSSESAVASSIDDFDIISNKTQKSVNILRGITDLTYIESIRHNTVGVNVTYADNGVIFEDDKLNGKSVIEGLPLVGSEKCSIRFRDNNGVSIELGNRQNNYLFVNKVTPLVNQAEKGLVTLNLVSKEFIMNERGCTRVVRRMDGKISDSVDSIFKNNLKTEKKLDIEETENNFNFIPNNKKPMYILDWISKKSVPKGKKGESAGFFFWETTNGFHFKSIDWLMDSDKNKPKKSIIYNETTDKKGENIPEGYQAKALEFVTDNKINVQDKFKMGFQSTRIITFNPFDGYYEVKSTEANANTVDTAGRELSTTYMNTELNCGGTGNNYTRTTYYIKDVGTLTASGKENTEKQLEKSKDENFEFSNIENQAIRRYNQLFSAETIVTIGGDFSLHAGDQVRIDFSEYNKKDDVDKKDGGSYMISDLVHYISSSGTFTKMNLVRDSFGRKGGATSTVASGR